MKRLLTVVELLLFVVAALLIACAFLSSCAAGAPALKTYAQLKAEVEKTGPFIDTKAEVRGKFDPGQFVELKPGDVVPWRGMLFDKNKVLFYEVIAEERDRRRTEVEVERKKASIDKLIYEQSSAYLTYENKKYNSWWERNKGLMGLAVGTILGMAITTGLVYGLTKGKATTSSSAMKTTTPLLTW